MTKRTEVFDKVYKAAEHFQRTGKHKQVSFRYNPEVRTGFDFSTWKHESDSDSVRKILVEDVRVSSEGMVYATGVDNRYNLKQFAKQQPQHVRSYRIDRMVMK
tara:strand:- start:3654 stop:3962 length:309 start_codon:yes stop_codon:yes gene_type:complete